MALLDIYGVLQPVLGIADVSQHDHTEIGESHSGQVGNTLAQEYRHPKFEPLAWIDKQWLG